MRPLPADAEWRWNLVAREPTIRERRHEAARESNATPIARHGTRGANAGRTGDVSHGEPPSWEGPGRPLPRTGGGGQDLVSIVGRRPQVQVLEDGGQLAVESGSGRHATCPPGTGVGAGSGSAVTAGRIAASA